MPMTNDSHSTTAFPASVALVLDQVRHIRDLCQSARPRLLRFAIDVCLVAHGIRSGYLVDAVCPPNPFQTFNALVTALRDKSPAFKDVACWHHAPTTQSFFVHVPLLRMRLAALLDGAEQSIFIGLQRPLSVSREPPINLGEALRNVMSSITEHPCAVSFTLSDVFTQVTLVPLAAVMIDYPVAYAPAFSEQTSFLEGEALDVYTIFFKETTPAGSSLGLGAEHVLLKFSCPHVLVANHPELSPGTIIECLNTKFTARLERIGTRMSITHCTETPLDRVAL